MPRLAVIAYCAQNLGDDLFVRLLANRYPNHDIALVSAPHDALGPLRDLDRLSCIDFATFRATAKEHDALVVLGGSMFQQRRGWARSWAAYARRFRVATRAGIPILVIGASFGPFSTARYPKAFRQLFRLCNWVSFRDEASAALFSRLPRVTWFPDLAFGYDVSTIHQTPAGSGGPVGISVMEFGAERSTGDYSRSMSKLVTALARSRRVKLLSFQDTTSISDSRAAAAVLSQVDPAAARNVEICRYGDLGIDGLLGEMATCSAVVSTRFHSMITAVILNRPVVSIGYHAKVTDTIDALGLDVPVVDFDATNETSKIIQMLECAETSQPADMSPLATLARRHFEGLDRIVGIQ